MPQILGKPIEQVLDGENNRVEFDIAYPVKGNLIDAVDQLRDLHGPELYLLPMSATSSGGGIFQNKNRPSGTIVGLRFDPRYPRACALPRNRNWSKLPRMK